MHPNLRQQPHSLTSLVPEEQGLLAQVSDHGPFTVPNSALSTAFSDIRHCQSLLHTLSWVPWYQSGFWFFVYLNIGCFHFSCRICTGGGR
jgi:hypothetical protein